MDENGQRTDFKLDLIEKQRDNMIKTGIWTPDSGVNYTMTIEEADSIVVKQLQNMTLRVVTVEVQLSQRISVWNLLSMFSFQNTPFTIYKAHDVPKEALERLSFEEKYEGYVIDFMKALSEEVKFKYKFHLVGDGKYGSLNTNTGEWNGMIRELLDHKADVAVVDLSMTSQRQSAVDFTMPYMNTGLYL